MSYARGILVVIFALALQLYAQAPLDVIGVNDRGVYTDSATFRVPALSGYSYYVTVDGQRIPADATNVVRFVDYHEIFVARTNLSTGATTNRLVRFIIQSSNRGSPERGLIEWTPYPPIPSSAAEMAGAQLKLVAPAEFPAGIPIPVAAWVQNSESNIVRVNGFVNDPSLEQSSFRLVRGHGFGILQPRSVGTLNYNGQLQNLNAQKAIEIENTSWTTISGTLPASANWPANSRIHVTAHLTIPAGGTLTIGEGTIVRLNAGVNITNDGRTVIDGTLERPVVFTPTGEVSPHQHANAWGGFYVRNSGAEVIANGTIFTGAGFATSGVSAHRREQALFLMSGGGRAYLTNSFILNLAGQVGNGNNGHLIFDRTHVQRAITCGEYGGGSTFTINKSAVIEFPAIDGIYNPQIADSDYDGIYFTGGTYVLSDTLIGFCKDDAIDAGSGPAGTVLVTNCWIESALHESLAWSREGRVTRTYDTVSINSGQGIEAGHSGSGQGFPDVLADRLLTTANAVGIRFGDNYDWEYYGRLRVTNSLSIYNYRDILAKTWNNPKGSSWDTNSWVDRLAQMDIRSNFFTTAYVQWPSNKLWQTEGDPSLLAHWMTTPENAAVGAGLAVWTNQVPIASFFNGIPVRLSSFTTNTVIINYRATNNTGVLAQGSLTFYPGETVKNIRPTDTFHPAAANFGIELTSGVNAEITGQNSLRLTGSVQTPAISLLSSGGQTTFGRLSEGIAVQLSNPALVPVTANYSFQTLNGDAQSGTVHFEPGQTIAWISLNSPSTTNMARLSLGNPTGGTLTNQSLLFIDLPASDENGPITLISRGSVWRYLDNGTDQGTVWRSTNFNDSAWSSGPAQLGFGESDQATILASGFITYYFRKAVVVEPGQEFQSVNLWLLRDDAGVIYVNGTEVFRSPNITSGTINYLTEAGSTGENTIDQITIPGSHLREGTNIIAVEIHQESTGSSDVSFDFEMVATPMPDPNFAPEVYSAEFDPNQLTIAWAEPGYGLQEADSVAGPWRPLALQGPVTVSMLSTQKFYRLRQIQTLPPVTLIPRASIWNYLDNGSDQGTSWRTLEFDDAGWSSGAAQLGFGESDQATVLQEGGITYYFRREFNIVDPAAFTQLNLWLLRDDAGVVYLNGTEVFRSPNLPGGTINFQTLATATGENDIETTTIPASLLRAGRNILAVEIHQESTGSSDVSFDFELMGTPAGSF